MSKNKSKEVFYQQGDVLLFKVGSIPKDCKPVKPNYASGKFVLAEGEQTGHAHTFDAGGGVAVLEAPDKKLFVEVKKSASKEARTVRHQEHKPITIPPGKYERKLVQEVDPYSKEVGAVRD